MIFPREIRLSFRIYMSASLNILCQCYSYCCYLLPVLCNLLLSAAWWDYRWMKPIPPQSFSGEAWYIEGLKRRSYEAGMKLLLGSSTMRKAGLYTLCMQPVNDEIACRSHRLLGLTSMARAWVSLMESTAMYSWTRRAFKMQSSAVAWHEEGW